MVKEIYVPQLLTFEDPKHFFTSGSGVVFRAETTGATTPNSTNPRSELRQMKPGGAQEASWSNASQTWAMDAYMAFTHLPGGKPHVVGMQVHDGKDDVTVLRLEGTQLYITKGNDTHHIAVPGAYTLGTPMSVAVVAQKGGGITWTINGVNRGGVGGVKSGCYFKAGCYTQASPSSTPPGSGYGETTFWSLRAFQI